MPSLFPRPQPTQGRRKAPPRRGRRRRSLTRLGPRKTIPSCGLRGSPSLDHRQFNIRNDAGQVLCPVCGWPGYFRGSSYDERGGLIATGICPSCLFEPGFDDDPGASREAEQTVPASILKYRADWVADGTPWRGRSGVGIPANWDARIQLGQLIDVAPEAIKPSAT